MIPRLNGKEIEKNFDYYLRLVKKGIAGFIVFGGGLDTVRLGIRELQKESKKPLIIASDLEQGLGQQIEGGTIFPPAMAIASAIKSCQPSAISYQEAVGAGLALPLLRKTYKAIAAEAKYAGINTIFAPVLDINTNPKNPIISTRAFGEDRETVSFFGCEMIKVLQSMGITACGKHFPGHGDTKIDSHLSIPSIKKNLRSLKETELVPFRDAIKQGVKMIMLGHLKVPALDSLGIPVSLSEKTVRYLRDEMRFKGILITDALNMGAIGKYLEEKASLMALRAGVDLLLHPTNPDGVAAYLEKKLSAIGYRLSGNKLFSKKLKTPAAPDFERHKRLSEELARKAIRVSGQIKEMKRPILIVLNDDNEDKGRSLISKLRVRYHNLRYFSFKAGEEINLSEIGSAETIAAVFSGIKAWKGGPGPWLIKCLKELENRAEIFISFGSPYLLDNIGEDKTKIYAYWDSDIAQKAAAELFTGVRQIYR
ncbi:MAG: hypothetical protein HY754_11360 [Nitrospirae bacterium]|nr:hypothetical protein [Nitrospirota bacterium]